MSDTTEPDYEIINGMPYAILWRDAYNCGARCPFCRHEHLHDYYTGLTEAHCDLNNVSDDVLESGLMMADGTVIEWTGQYIVKDRTEHPGAIRKSLLCIEPPIISDCLLYFCRNTHKMAFPEYHEKMPYDLYYIPSEAPEALQTGLQTIARYFGREMDDDGAQVEFERPTFTHFFWTNSSNQMIGGCLFIKNIYPDPPSHSLFRWVWLHPYCRNRGLLSEAWPFFSAQFAPIIPSKPISHAMKGFLKKQQSTTLQLGDGTELVVYTVADG